MTVLKHFFDRALVKAPLSIKTGSVRGPALTLMLSEQ